MAPSTKNEGLKNTKNQVKRFIGKMIQSKEKNKNDIPENKEEDEDVLVFDALPDEEHKTDEESPNFNNRQSSESSYMQEERNSYDNNKMFNESIEEISEEKEKIKSEGKKEKEKSERKNERKPKSDENATNVFNISDVKEVHIGPRFQQSHTIIQNYNVGDAKHQEKQDKKKVKLTPQIKELMQSTVKLDNRHIQCLSRHFGESWRKIGMKLKFSSGELDIFEHLCKNNLQEISFQVLTHWIQKNGEKATVGKLCTKLWKSDIGNAQEAVEKMAEKITLLNK